jgi:hypothetical protein
VEKVGPGLTGTDGDGTGCWIVRDGIESDEIDCDTESGAEAH